MFVKAFFFFVLLLFVVVFCFCLFVCLFVLFVASSFFLCVSYFNGLLFIKYYYVCLINMDSFRFHYR